MSKRYDDAMAFLDRALAGGDAPPTTARIYGPQITNWFCATDDIIVGQADHLLPPRCEHCGEFMVRYQTRNDPTRADRPNW